MLIALGRQAGKTFSRLETLLRLGTLNKDKTYWICVDSNHLESLFKRFVDMLHSEKITFTSHAYEIKILNGSKICFISEGKRR